MTLVLGAVHIFTTPAAKLHLAYNFMLFLLFLCTESLPLAATALLGV